MKGMVDTKQCALASNLESRVDFGVYQKFHRLRLRWIIGAVRTWKTKLGWILKARNGATASNSTTLPRLEARSFKDMWGSIQESMSAMLLATFFDVRVGCRAVDDAHSDLHMDLFENQVPPKFDHDLHFPHQNCLLEGTAYTEYPLFRQIHMYDNV